MKKLLSLLFFLSLIVLTTLVLLPFPQEQAIFIESKGKYAVMYVNGEIKNVPAANLKYPKFTVLNFRRNLIKAYDFSEVNPTLDRIMCKSSNAYDLESMGQTSLSKKTYYYKIDKNNNITKTSSKDIIVGQKNVKSYIDSNGALRTFIIYPINYSNIRVGISSTDFSSLYHNKIELKCANPCKLYNMRENFSTNIPANSDILIEKQGDSMEFLTQGISKTFKSRIYIAGNSINVTSIKRGESTFTPSYDGTLEFNLESQGITLINELPIENYLYKVVPSEMPSSANIEALKCQAVAARTYAVSDMLGGRFSNLGFHVDDSTKSQVYNNIATQPSTTQAVNETKGIFMTYDGSPIDAKYYSTSCGTGVSYDDIWFTADDKSERKPYLRTVNFLASKAPLPNTEKGWLHFFKDWTIESIDNNSPYYRWYVDFSPSGLTKCLNKTLKSLYVLSPGYVTFKNTKDNKSLSFPKLVNLKDIQIVKRGTGGNVIEILFKFENAEVSVKEDVNIRSAIKCDSTYTGEPTQIINPEGYILTGNTISLPSSFFSVEKSSGRFVISGGGFGHGVGMSQYGAIELAKRGMKFNQILNIYYKNIKLTSSIN